MNICYITRPDLLPATHGAAVKIVHTAEALSKKGGKVAIVTNDRVWFMVATDGRLIRRRYPQTLLSLSNIPLGLKSKLHKLGFPNYWKGLQRALDAIGYPRDEHFLYQSILDVDFLLRVLYVGWAHDIDVFQAEFPGYAAPAIVAAKLFSKKAMLAEHNIEYERLRATTGLSGEIIKRLQDIELSLCERVDHVVTCSQLEKDDLLKNGVATPISVIPHGVELAPYREFHNATLRLANQKRIKARYRLPPDVPVLVFHGTLHYWPNTVAVKRIAEELLPCLSSLGVEVSVLICGMNPPRYYDHPQIFFTEMVQDLPEHLSAADVAVVPLEDGGGTRLKILEYFAAKVPVVSTQKGAEGIPAVDGTTLLLRDDMTAMAEAVKSLLQDQTKAQKLALNGLLFAEAYSWDAVATAWMQVYEGQAVQPFRLAETPEIQEKSTNPPPKTMAPIVYAPRDKEPVPLPSDPIEGVAGQLPVKFTPSKPNTMIIMINRGCNLRCDFCDLYEYPKLFKEAEIRPILEDAARMGVKTVVFTGGEPTLHPGLWRMIALAKSLGMGTNITTNGTTIEKHLGKILSSGLDSLSVSLDGLKNTHEELRKIDGCFDQTVSGLKALKKAGFEHINIYFVITGKNVSELKSVYKLAKKLGCGFDFWPVNDAHDLYIVDRKSRAAYRKAIKDLAKVDPAVAAKSDYYMAGLDYHAGWDKRVRCLGLIEQFGVNLDGELVPCCVWDNEDLKIGPLAGKDKRSLPELWYGDAAKNLRQEIYNTGCHNRCFNHSLYEFQIATGQSFVVGEGALPFKTVVDSTAQTKALPSAPTVAITQPKPKDQPPHLPGSYLVLELANGCNLKCQHCAQADPDHPHYKTTGFFPRKAVKALLQDLKMKGARFDTLILFWLGEPLIHPEFLGIYQDILDATEADADGNLGPFAKVEVHTNAILLNENFSKAILNDHPLPQRWHFTIDAAKQSTYKNIKGADQLEKVEANIKTFYDLKSKSGKKWPNTALQYIVSDENEAEADAFIARWKNVADGVNLKMELVAHFVPEIFDREWVFLKSLDCPTAEEQRRQNGVYKKVVKRYGLDKKANGATINKRIKAKNLNPCSGFWKSPVISYDGMLTTCTRDNLGINSVGNVLETPFTDLWWNENTLKKWRKSVAKGNYDELTLCKTCFIPQSLNYSDITPEEIKRAETWASKGDKT